VYAVKDVHSFKHIYYLFYLIYVYLRNEIETMEKHITYYILHILRVCSLNYPACNAHARIVICGLSDCHIFPHIS
jgi:hypothetical protein